MAHTHPINDTDTHFKIDGITRLVKNVSETKAMLVQYDHNSEKFTFEVPRKVDDHDLSLCNIVRVHYINIDKSKRTENKGVCDITETLAICPDDDECVTCSWLISSNATQLVGSLYFVIQFACIEGDRVLYSWNTARHTGVSIIDGIDNGKDIDEEFLADWEQKINDTLITNVTQTVFSDESNGDNVFTFTFGDGSTKDFVVKNGSRGEKSLIGSIETKSGEPLHFWVGTQAEYNALTESQRKDCFCIITNEDDPDMDELKGILLGTNPVAKATEADHATNADSATSANVALALSKIYHHSVFLKVSLSRIGSNTWYPYIYIKVNFTDDQATQHNTDFFKNFALGKSLSSGNGLMFSHDAVIAEAYESGGIKSTSTVVTYTVIREDWSTYTLTAKKVSSSGDLVETYKNSINMDSLEIVGYAIRQIK